MVISVKPDQPRPTPIRTNGQRKQKSDLVYDPSLVFLLELATIAATRDAESVTLMGQSVADMLQNVVRDTSNNHPLVLARAVYYLLYILEASQDFSFVRAPVILHTISGYEQSTLETAENEVTQGLALCLRRPSPLRSEMTNTPDFWLILRSLHARPTVAGQIFDLIRNVVEARPTAVTADNYEAVISLLTGFASGGSIGAATEQQRDKKSPEQREKRQQKKDTSSREPAPDEREAVERGHGAVVMIYQLTGRIPGLIKQSHLERKEGKQCSLSCSGYSYTNCYSLDDLLVARLRSAMYTMLEPLPADPTPSLHLSTEFLTLPRIGLPRTSRVDCNL